MSAYRSRTSTHGRNMAGARSLWRATGMTDLRFPLLHMKNIFSALVISLCLFVASYAAEKKEQATEYSESSASIKTISDIKPDEYQVYAAVFASGKLDGMPFGYVVLEKETRKEKIHKDNWKDVDGFMLDDFNKKNEREYPLEDKFQKYKSPSAHKSLNIEVRDQRDKRLGPFDMGRTSVSRVGFNKNKTKALVYVQHIADPEMGVGYYVLLDKVGGIWVITGSGIGRMF